MNTQIQTFQFQLNQSVRVEMKDGEPLFCLKDVAEILEIQNTKQSRFNLKEDGVHKMYLTDKLGREQEATFINEPNLYRVIFRSNKQEAVKFQDWIFEKVIPQIRKTGSYAIEQAQAAALPPSHKYALDVNEVLKLADLPLATYLYHLIRFYARAYGISRSSVNSLLADKFNYGKPIHKMSLNTLTRSVMWMHEELDKVPCVDFGVSRSDLLNIFKRQCQYKRDFENWSEWQLQSWLDEMFFRSEKTRYMGYPTSLESATYAQLEKLVDGMKHCLSGDFQLLANSLREQNRVLPKLRGDDGSIGQVLCSYGAGSPDSIAVSWALQDMTILRRVFDYFTFLSYENGEQDEEWAGDIRSCNVILNNLSTMLLEASSHTLMKS